MKKWMACGWLAAAAVFSGTVPASEVSSTDIPGRASPSRNAAACAPDWDAFTARPRVVFDRPGGFTVRQGEEAALTATLAGGSGGIWFLEDRWESNNGGHVTGSDNETFVIDTSVPGLYWVKAVGVSDGTDGEFAGKIRFRVAPAQDAATKGAR